MRFHTSYIVYLEIFSFLLGCLKYVLHIVETYQKFNEGKLPVGIVEDKFSYVATFEEIKENDFNLNIPRYVDTFEEEAEVDIAAVQTEINKLEEELKVVQAELAKYLKELTD